MVAVILVEPFEPLNVAAAARAMASFDAGPLVLVSPVFDMTALEPQVARGGTPLLDGLVLVSTLEEARERFDVLVATTGKESGPSHLRSYLTPFELAERGPWNDRCAFVFGRESDGLRNHELELCDLVVSIETSEAQRALNLSHAVAVVLAIAHGARDPVQRRHEPASRRAREALIDRALVVYERAAQPLGEYTADRAETQRAVWRHVLGKANATEQEVRTLFGFVDAAERALGKDAERSVNDGREDP